MLRNDIYSILNYNIDVNHIIKDCYLYFEKKLKNVEHKKMLIDKAQYYQCNMVNGNKNLIHIEGFVMYYVYLLKKES